MQLFVEHSVSIGQTVDTLIAIGQLRISEAGNTLCYNEYRQFKIYPTPAQASLITVLCLCAGDVTFELLVNIV